MSGYTLAPTDKQLEETHPLDSSEPTVLAILHHVFDTHLNGRVVSGFWSETKTTQLEILLASLAFHASRGPFVGWYRSPCWGTLHLHAPTSNSFTHLLIATRNARLDPVADTVQADEKASGSIRLMLARSVSPDETSRAAFDLVSGQRVVLHRRE
ncbi:hypothetical protein DFH06DRAFT_1291563 [Mycena polygramma]|nr:hypothetical protein DFH06DRAFT_1291563 [Mycena polygramma]